MTINKRNFLNLIKKGVGAATPTYVRKSLTPTRSVKTELTKLKSSSNITKLATKAGIVPGPNYGKRIKYAENLFSKGKAREARLYLQGEGRKIKKLNE